MKKLLSFLLLFSFLILGRDVSAQSLTCTVFVSYIDSSLTQRTHRFAVYATFSSPQLAAAVYSPDGVIHELNFGANPQPSTTSLVTEIVVRDYPDGGLLSYAPSWIVSVDQGEVLCTTPFDSTILPEMPVLPSATAGAALPTSNNTPRPTSINPQPTFGGSQPGGSDCAPNEACFLKQVNPLFIASDGKIPIFPSPATVINRFIQFFLFPLAGLILFMMILWGGFEMLSGASNTKSQEAGKQRITAAVIGFILLFVSYWIAQMVQFVFQLNFL